jgi:hypothetical protein
LYLSTTNTSFKLASNQVLKFDKNLQICKKKKKKNRDKKPPTHKTGHAKKKKKDMETKKKLNYYNP